MARRGKKGPAAPPLDVDAVLARGDAARAAANRPPPMEVRYFQLGWGYSSRSSTPDPDPAPVRPKVMPGHVPNTMSSRERRARRDQAAAAAKKSQRAKKRTQPPA